MQDFEAKLKKNEAKKPFLGLFLNPGPHKNAGLEPKKAGENTLFRYKKSRKICSIASILTRLSQGKRLTFPW